MPAAFPRRGSRGPDGRVPPPGSTGVRTFRIGERAWISSRRARPSYRRGSRATPRTPRGRDIDGRPPRRRRRGALPGRPPERLARHSRGRRSRLGDERPARDIDAGSPNLLAYSLFSAGAAPFPAPGPRRAGRRRLDDATSAARLESRHGPRSVESYELEIRRSPAEIVVYPKVVGAPTTEQLVPNGILADKISYKWRVRAENDVGRGPGASIAPSLVRFYVHLDLSVNDAEDGITRSEPEMAKRSP